MKSIITMDLKKEIESSQITLVVLGDAEYSSKLLELTGIIDREFKRICYVSLKSPCSTLIKDFRKRGISPDKFVFIDCVSHNSGPNIINVPSPDSLTEICIAINKVFSEMKCNALIFDFLSPIALHENKSMLERSIRSLTTMLRNTGIKSVFIISKKDMSQEVSCNIGMFMDNVVGGSLSGRMSLGKIINDLNSLMDRLFGTATRKIIEAHRKDVKPEVYIRHWREMMSIMVGPDNADIQLASIRKKHLGGKK